jgi:hypothetical protein
METKKSQDLTPFALGLLCGGVAVAFAMRLGSSDDVHRPMGTIAEQERLEDHAGRPAEGLELPAAEPVRRAPADRVALPSESAPELESALEQLPAAIPTLEQLEQRYQDYSLPELIGAEKSLGYVVHHESGAFLDKKIERGLFTTQILPLGAPFELSGTFPDGAPRSTRTVWHTRNDGLAEVWLAEIHPKEQPLLEARHFELAWLSARVHSLTKDDE